MAVVGLVSAGPGIRGDLPDLLNPPVPAVRADATPSDAAGSEAPARLASLAPAAGVAGQPVEEDVAPAAQALDVSPEPQDKLLTIRRGDTLMEMLLDAGADRSTAHEAITALAKVYDPRRLRPGQTLTASFGPAGDSTTDSDNSPGDALLGVTLHVEPALDVMAHRGGDGAFAAESVEKPLETKLHRAEAPIDDSLYLAASRAGVPVDVIIELISMYSFDIDFQRDIQPGDHFEVLFESQYVEDGGLARHGNILYARLRVGGQDLPLYRYRSADGHVDYYNDKGHSVRKALMKTPVDGARLSSRFGRRHHPILGYTRMHRGVDFAAPKGTPIMAAGDGTVELAGWNGTYGQYVRIRHNGRYKTAYAHMNRFARGITKGKRVRQGQIIGYIGTTGRSTGPHLHYEVLVDGKQINPLGLKLPTGRELGGKELAKFQDKRQTVIRQFASTPTLNQVATQD